MHTTKKEFRDAKKKLQKSNLSPLEKSSMLASIYNQIPPKAIHATPSHFFRFWKNTSTTLALVILFVISATLVSAKSLPGDLLYKMKIKMIEPAVFNLHLGEEAKEKYREKLIGRRIQELHALQMEGRLNPEARKDSIDAIINIINLSPQREDSINYDSDTDLKIHKEINTGGNAGTKL